MFKKGQSAMEFLTTYGWAFLVIIAVIAGMSYFGIFDTGRFVHPSCSLDANMACPVFAAYHDFSDPKGDYVFEINFENFLSENIRVVDFVLQEKVGEEFCHTNNVTDFDSNLYTTPDQDIIATNTPDYSNGALIPPNRNLDLKFTFVNSAGATGCNFDKAGLTDPVEGRKVSYNFKMYYLQGSSNKPLVTSGTLIVPITST